MLGRERAPAASGWAPVAVDRGRDLDDRVVGQVRDRAVVAHVHDLDVARSRRGATR